MAEPDETLLSNVHVNVKLEFFGARTTDDGRWAAEAVDLSGVLAYGKTRTDAGRAVLALAFRTLADQLDEHAEVTAILLDALALRRGQEPK